MVCPYQKPPFTSTIIMTPICHNALQLVLLDNYPSYQQSFLHNCVILPVVCRFDNHPSQQLSLHHKCVLMPCGLSIWQSPFLITIIITQCCVPMPCGLSTWQPPFFTTIIITQPCHNALWFVDLTITLTHDNLSLWLQRDIMPCSVSYRPLPSWQPIPMTPNCHNAL